MAIAACNLYANATALFSDYLVHAKNNPDQLTKIFKNACYQSWTIGVDYVANNPMLRLNSFKNLCRSLATFKPNEDYLGGEIKIEKCLKDSVNGSSITSYINNAKDLIKFPGIMKECEKKLSLLNCEASDSNSYVPFALSVGVTGILVWRITHKAFIQCLENTKPGELLELMVLSTTTVLAGCVTNYLFNLAFPS